MSAPLRYGSVCTGIATDTVAWGPLGWQAAWYAEIERAPCELLAHRYPQTPNLGDMTRLPALVAAGLVEAPDILCGGTPCQAFSLAGRREGLADPRGRLTLAFVDLADAIDAQRAREGLPPSVIVWENVPGVLSHKDNPFGCFLAALAGEDLPLVPSGRKWTNAGVVLGPQRAVAWRVLDAQYFGLAQRRRRVVVVASARAGFDPGNVLLEFEGLRRDSPPRREAREDITHAVAPCLTGSGRGVERVGDPRGQDPVVAYRRADRLDLSGLQGGEHGLRDADDLRVVLGAVQDVRSIDGGSDRLEAFGGNNQSGPIEVATARSAHGGPHGRLDFETETFVVQAVSWTLQANGRAAGSVTQQDAENAMLVVQSVALRGREGGATAELGGEQAYALRAADGGGSDPYVLAPVAFVQNSRSEVRLVDGDGQITGALTAEPGAQQQHYIAFRTVSNGDAFGDENIVSALTTQTDPSTHLIAFSCKDYGADASEEVAPTLRAMGHSGSHANAGGQLAVSLQMRVRRLLPVECERLQGLPDDYTLVPKGKGFTADGPRYKEIGNGWAAPVFAWVGARIAAEVARGDPVNDNLEAELLLAVVG